MTERLRVREIDDDEGRRLVRIVRRGTGSVVTWRRAQMVLLSAQGMNVAAIAKVAFTSEDRVRDVIRNFNADGFSSLYPRYRGGCPPKFTLPQRREIKKIAKSKPTEHDLPFSTWSLAKLAEFMVAEGVVDDISHEGLRTVLREEGVTFQRLKTWKTSKDPDYAVGLRARFAAMSTADPHTPQPPSSMTLIRPEEPPVKASADLVAAPGTRPKVQEAAPRCWGRDAGRRARSCVPDRSVGHGYSRSLAEPPKCVLTCGKTGQVGVPR